MASHSDLNKDVFVPSPKKHIIKNATGGNHTTTYCAWINRTATDPNGNPILEGDKAWEEAEAAAYKQAVGAITKYYVKVNSHSGEFFNPQDKTQVYQAGRVVQGLPLFRMTEVNKNQFDNYVHFLKTRDQKFLIQARKAY